MAQGSSPENRVLLILPPSENIDDSYRVMLGERFPQLVFDWAHHYSHALDLAADARVILTFSPFMHPSVAEAARRLEWIQVLGSGLDGVVGLPFRNPVIITHGRGVQAAPVSEAALGLIFAVSRGYRPMLANQAAHAWARWPSALLDGKTVTILGVGAIAEALAPKCAALGMRVTGVSSSPRDIPGFERIYPKAQLHAAAAEADFLVVLTPYGPETRHMVGAAVFAAMKPSAHLVNVARGGVVDEAALIVALQAGSIAGAALDVFETQPLPASSPLWDLPNVIVSPHMAGLNTDYARQIMPLLEANFRAFLSGDRAAMRNVHNTDAPRA